jgi:molybdate transport system substrate-binding protein
MCVIRSVLLTAALLAFAGTTEATELKVMGDAPLGPALSKIADLYRQQTNTQVDLVLAPSPVVKQKIEAGEAADMVIVQPDFVDELAKAGKVVAGDRPIIGRVGIGLGTRSDRPAWDISTPEKLKQSLVGVDTYPSTKSNREITSLRCLSVSALPKFSSPRSCARRPLGFLNLC